MKPKIEVRFETDYWEDPYEHYHIKLLNIELDCLSIICPHCQVYSVMRIDTIIKRFDFGDDGIIIREKETVPFDLICNCPNCRNTIFVKAQAYLNVTKNTEINESSGGEIVEIFPSRKSVKVYPEVPDKYADHFRKAQLIIDLSPEASAALSRRILQNIIREEFNIRKRNLSFEIEEFVKLQEIPSYLAKSVDAIRNIGNFAAHPTKDINTGEIVDVEPGEAEWLIEVLDALFDFTFVQPKLLKDRKKKLNEKLKGLGKPSMK